MARNPIVMIVASGLVAAGVAGCSSSADTTAQPAPPPHETAVSAAPVPISLNGAPPVATPLDATAFLGNPCRLLNDGQAAQLRIVRPGEPDTASQLARTRGPSCTWEADELGTTFEMSFMHGTATGSAQGLPDLYRNKTQFDYFEETSAGDHPGVFYDRPDSRQAGSCQLAVAISDHEAFRAVERGSSDSADAVCAGARNLAAMIVDSLKRGA